MYGFDPISLAQRDVNEWLNKSEDNILLVFDKNAIGFNTPDNNSEKIFCLKKKFIFNPKLKDYFVKCVLENE